MKSKCLMLSLVFVIACSCFVRADNPSDLLDLPPKPYKVTENPYQIAPLDKILVTLSDDSVETFLVSQDGTIDLDDKTIHVEGLSADEAISIVHRHVSDVEKVHIEEFRQNKVTILGEVYHQIYTEMGDGPMRVLDAIAAANGFTPLANTRRVKLVRENAGQVEIYELDLRDLMRGKKTNQNILVKPGDVITVPRNFL